MRTDPSTELLAVVRDASGCMHIFGLHSFHNCARIRNAVAGSPIADHYMEAWCSMLHYNTGKPCPVDIDAEAIPALLAFLLYTG